MTLESQLVRLAHSDPATLRAILQDEAVVKALQAIGVRSAVLQLHAPMSTREGASGFGKTLCKITATRHMLVTCKKCLHEQSKRTGVMEKIPARPGMLPRRDLLHASSLSREVGRPPA